MMNTEILLKFAEKTQQPEKIELINQTTREIGNGWISCSLEQIKEDFPLAWQKIVNLEETINKMALQDNIEGLGGILREYKELMLSLTGRGK